MGDRNQRIGLVGLGLVGSALVDRFRSFDCVGFDIDEAARKRAEGRGCRTVNSAAAVAESAGQILLSLPDSDVVEQVVEGQSGLIEQCQRGDLVIDTTTSDPERCAQLAERLDAKGIKMVDATILGSSRMVADGTCLVMAGGQPEAFARAQTLLDTFASRIFHLGANGKGSEAKLIVNLVLGLNRLVLAEGLVLGRKAGLDLNQLLDIFRDGAAYSRVMDHKGDRMVQENFDPEARLAQHLKDVGLILDMGMKQGIRLPVSSLHANILRKGVEEGLADQDNSAVIKALEQYISDGRNPH